jgi:hypothetical protein
MNYQPSINRVHQSIDGAITPDRTFFDNLIKRIGQCFLSKETLGMSLGVSPRTIESWRYRYEDFPASKIGKHVRYNLPEVLQWVERTFGGTNGK